MDIIHDVRQRKFYSLVKDTEYSIEYNEVESGSWEFHCPIAPTSEKEKVFQDKVIEYALFFAKRNNIRLIEVCNCPYIRDFLIRKEELAAAINNINC